MLLLVSPVASAASSTPPSSMRGSRLARLLTETQPGQLLTLSECRALPVNFAASENSFGSVHCPGMMYYAPGFGYNNDQGICLFFDGSVPSSYADAQAKCANLDADAVLWAPRDDAERCLMTDILTVINNDSVFTGVTDAQTEGEYVDHEGVPIPDVYLNWDQHPDTPNPPEPNGGTSANCFVVTDLNFWRDHVCDNAGAPDIVLCVKRLPAS